MDKKKLIDKKCFNKLTAQQKVDSFTQFLDAFNVKGIFYIDGAGCFSHLTPGIDKFKVIEMAKYIINIDKYKLNIMAMEQARQYVANESELPDAQKTKSKEKFYIG